MPTVRELLDFENRHPRHTSRKEALIVDELGMKPARYYQVLRSVAASVEGQAVDPITAHRITDRLANRRRG